MGGPNIPASTRQITPVCIHLSGGRSTVTAGLFSSPVVGIARWVAPQRCYLARAAAAVWVRGGGNTPTITVDVQKGGVSMLSTPIALSTPLATVVTEGALALAATGDIGVLIAKDTVVTIDLNITGGSSPTAEHIDVQLDIVPYD